MKKKLGIIIPILLVLIVGAFAVVHFVMPSDTADDAASLPPVFDQTDSTEASGEQLDSEETPDTAPTTETLAASVELTEDELHQIFEEVYLKSVYSMRKYLGASMDSLIESEYNQIKYACPEGKILPEDYRELYDIWRENYRIEDLSYVFTDESENLYYATSNVASYTNIYDNIVVDSMEAKEAVIVTGIGYDRASGWLRIQTESGVSYAEASGLTNKIEDQFESVSKTMYATKDVYSYKTPKEEIAYKDSAKTVSKGDEVKVIGIGFGAAENWLKLDFGEGYFGGILYVRADNFTDSKGTSQDKGSSNSGSQQDNGSSGGNQGSNNESNGNSSGTGGNSSGSQSETGDYWLDTYGMTADQLRDLPAEQLIAMGFTQRSSGTWVDKTRRMLPGEGTTEEGMEDVRGDYGDSLQPGG